MLVSIVRIPSGSPCQSPIGIRHGRLNAHGLLPLACGPVEFSPLVQGEAQLIMGYGEIRIVRDCRLERLDGLVYLA